MKYNTINDTRQCVSIVENRHLKPIFIKLLNLFCQNSNTKNEFNEFNQSTIKYSISNYVLGIRNHKYIYIIKMNRKRL